jgi:Cd2+-exporting ATPase
LHCHKAGVEENHKHDHCDNKQAHYYESATSGNGGHGCCKPANYQATELEDDVTTNVSMSSDPEKGFTGYSRVVLSVQGLTCSSCESKLYRSLSSIPYIHNISTSLVLSLAEFDLDPSVGSVTGVIRAVKRTTGFKCEKLSAAPAMLGGAEGIKEMEVVVEGGVQAVIEAAETVRGVKEVVAVGGQIIRIQYDSNVVGARDLLHRFSDLPVSIAPAASPPSLAAGRKHVRSTAWMTLLSVCLTVPVLVMAWAPLPGDQLKYNSASLALATLVQFIVARPFYFSAIKSLIFTHVIEMDLLIVISTTIAYVYSVISFAFQVRGHPLPTGQFFETSTLLVTLIMVGRLVSAFARQWAVESISIKSLQATSAIIVSPDGRGEQVIDTRLLQYGDIFKVIPDSRLATDGEVLSGASEIDESMVTGESRLVEKRPGSTVVAGSVNGTGTLLVRLTRLPGENTISDIASMVDEAKSSKPKIQETADQFASYFVPIILFIALLTFIVWMIIGRLVWQNDISPSIITAITYAIPVLVVSCPCAIGLAVPMVIVVAGGIAAERGVIFKSAHVIETARRVSHVIFDKTGTLTQGKLEVIKEVYFVESHGLGPSLALGVTADINHPVSIAVAKHLKAQGYTPAMVEDVRSIPGKGVKGIYDGETIRGGNSRWLGLQSFPEVRSLLNQGLTVFCLSRNSQLLAIFGLEDSLRPDAKAVISSLTTRGIAVSIVSGDDKTAVTTLASELGIPAHHVRAECSPKDKHEYVKAACANGKETVIFCGDGTNDAVALAQATIGIHVNEGTDVAQSAADAVLIRPALSGITTLIDLSEASYRRIIFNFSWSFVYNFIAILLAAGVFIGARIPPEYAGLGELVSVLPVILVAVIFRWTARAKGKRA